MAEKELDQDDALHRIKTAGSITITPELFEKLYLSPQNQVKGDLRLTFANPTPYALCGFLLALTPLTCQLMGWRATNKLAGGAATIGTYFFFGGLMMIIGSVGEFILGNTFPCIVFGSFGAFWLSYGATLQDAFYGAITTYAQLDKMPNAGIQTPGYAQGYAFFLLFMGLLSFIYMICALRTNIVFFGIFLTLVPAFTLLAAAFWKVAEALEPANAKSATALASKAQTLQLAGGACAFVTCMFGWYIFTVIMLAAVDFPIELPLGDLSTVIKGAQQRKKKS